VWQTTSVDNATTVWSWTLSKHPLREIEGDCPIEHVEPSHAAFRRSGLTTLRSLVLPSTKSAQARSNWRRSIAYSALL
jgi:hypothetical protein